MPGTLERALEAGFRIRPGEERRTAIMAAYAASAIGAVVSGARCATLCTWRMATARGLSWLYILSSAAIVAVSYGYARVADKVPRGALNAISAASCAAMCAAFWGLVQFSAGRWVYPALYVFVEAMASLVVIQFWTMANDVFHAREAKRLFGLIGAGGTLANVIFGLLVSRYARRIGAPEPPVAHGRAARRLRDPGARGGAAHFPPRRSSPAGGRGGRYPSSRAPACRSWETAT